MSSPPPKCPRCGEIVVLKSNWDEMTPQLREGLPTPHFGVNDPTGTRLYHIECERLEFSLEEKARGT